MGAHRRVIAEIMIDITGDCITEMYNYSNDKYA